MTTGLHERVEYAISACGKVFTLYRKAVFFGVCAYVCHPKRVPLPRSDFRNCQNFQNGRPYNSKIFKKGILIPSGIPKFPTIPKFPKFPKLPNFPKFPISPKCPDLGYRISENIGGTFWKFWNFWKFLEVLEIWKFWKFWKFRKFRKFWKFWKSLRYKDALFGNFGIMCLQRVLCTSATDHRLVSNSRTELVQA